MGGTVSGTVGVLTLFFILQGGTVKKHPVYSVIMVEKVDLVELGSIQGKQREILTEG